MLIMTIRFYIVTVVVVPLTIPRELWQCSSRLSQASNLISKYRTHWSDMIYQIISLWLKNAPAASFSSFFLFSPDPCLHHLYLRQPDRDRQRMVHRMVNPMHVRTFLCMRTYTQTHTSSSVSVSVKHHKHANSVKDTAFNNKSDRFHSRQTESK